MLKNVSFCFIIIYVRIKWFLKGNIVYFDYCWWNKLNYNGKGRWIFNKIFRGL